MPRPDVPPGADLPSTVGEGTTGSAEVGHESPDEGATSDDDPPPAAPLPYTFAATDVPHAARVLDAAFTDLIEGWEGWGAIEKAVKEFTSPLSEECVRVLGQLAARPLNLELRGRPGTDLAVGGGLGLPSIRDVGADDVALWEALAEEVTAPAALARLSDLLFLRRVGNVGGHARRAGRAYLDAVGDRADDMDTTTYLVRAWTLCRLVKAAEVEGEVLDEIERRVDSLVAGDGKNRPGVLFPLVAALCEKPLDATQTTSLRDHANTVLTTLASVVSRADLASEVASMRRKVAGGAATAGDLAAIDGDELAGYLRDADASPNAAVRMHRLEAAARTATTRGMTNHARDIAAKMQAIRPEELGMQRISASSSLPNWVPESYLDEFTRGSDWRRGIAVFLLSPNAPSGSVSSLREYAVERRGSLGRLFSTTIYGNGLPQATFSSEAEQDRHDMAFAGRVAAENHGQLLAIALHRISERFGTPDLDELTGLLINVGAADPRLARSLAKGFIYFWAGDYEAAVCVLIPKIEAAARALLRELDEGIYRVQVDKSPGGYPGLYVLLTELEKLALDEDWAWFLRWLLLGPLGANIRNEVAHGFVTELTPTYTALVLRAAAVLITASPIADDLGRHVDVLPQLRPLTGAAHIADTILVKIATAGLRLHSAVEGRRARLRSRLLDGSSGPTSSA